MIFINLINCLESVYLYTIIKENKTNTILFINAVIHDEYNITLQSEHNFDFKKASEDERNYVIENGNVDFEVENYEAYSTDFQNMTRKPFSSYLLLKPKELLFLDIKIPIDFWNLTSRSFSIFYDQGLMINYLLRRLEKAFCRLKTVFSLLEGRRMFLLQDHVLYTKRQIERDFKDLKVRYNEIKGSKSEYVKSLIDLMKSRACAYESDVLKYEAKIANDENEN